ncbi:MAG: hypothetical protein RL323_1448 [Pseudomonadota bacterium]
MNKRHALMAGVALAAGAAGAGFAWWRMKPGAMQPAAEDAFWLQPWAGPDGQTVDLQALRGRPLLLNFWATWCPPCVEELPLLNRFYGQQRAAGWQVVGLAVDQPSAVRKFLQKTPVDFPVVMGGLGGTELSKQLGNTNGGLPYTVVFDAGGRVAHRKIGQVKPDDLALWAR